MPPRLPVVFLFVVGYFAAVIGGGPEAPLREPPPELWPFAAALSLSLGEALVFVAAALALVDASWRPACTAADMTISFVCAGVAVGAVWAFPVLLTSSYAALAALAIGDALAAAGRPGSALRRAA